MDSRIQAGAVSKARGVAWLHTTGEDKTHQGAALKRVTRKPKLLDDKWADWFPRWLITYLHDKGWNVWNALCAGISVP